MRNMQTINLLMQKLIIGFQIQNSNRTVASYNLGNAIYKQNQASEAKFAYAELKKY
jgi:predicted lipid-binding transport protein (Tim44 family)